MSLSDDVARWMRQQQAAAGARGFAVGLSGGVDSAVALRLCQIAAPGQTVGVILPCHSDPQDERDARLVADHWSVPTVRIELDAAYDQLVAGLRPPTTAVAAVLGAQAETGTESRGAGPDVLAAARLRLSNIKPRLRMTALYYVAGQLGYVVVGTGNRSELTIGYFTKYGDGGVDLLPLGNLLKSEVRALALDLGVPEAIVDKPPSAGLWLGQTDEGDMGFTYAELDAYVERGPELVTPAVAMKIERLMRASEHKRRLPPIYGQDNG